jgi:hypothetical protein
MNITFCNYCGRGLVIGASNTIKSGEYYYHRDWKCHLKMKNERKKKLGGK